MLLLSKALYSVTERGVTEKNKPESANKEAVSDLLYLFSFKGFR